MEQASAVKVSIRSGLIYRLTPWRSAHSRTRSPVRRPRLPEKLHARAGRLDGDHGFCSWINPGDTFRISAVCRCPDSLYPGNRYSPDPARYLQGKDWQTPDGKDGNGDHSHRNRRSYRGCPDRIANRRLTASGIHPEMPPLVRVNSVSYTHLTLPT